ncbi:MAG TPA: hypothetical protein VHC73_06385 [Vitreimonas sp.]|jgi:hypothetical protein|nr:hypothetical protein [Vitreimonas sp.]
MTFTRPNIIKGAVLAALAGGAFLATSAPASAAVVCNRWGECWRTRVAYAYPPRLGVVVRDDAWVRAHPHYHWRAAHRGRGYWRNGYWHRW